MKKLYLFLTLLLSFMGADMVHALDLPIGIMSLGNEITTLETGKWYFLYNRGAGTYAKEANDGSLTQAIAPNSIEVTGNEGYLMTLEDAGNGQYYIKTGLGHYFNMPVYTPRGTGDNPVAITIEGISGNAGHFLIKGGSYNLVALTDGSTLRGRKETAVNGIADWAFVEVKIASVDELTGRALYDYQMSKLGLVRLHNKRTSTAYLTTNNYGSASASTLISKTEMKQVWILEKSGVGYTLRSAENGQYLQEDFGTPANGKTVLYIKFSPNNTGTDAYINISTAQEYDEKDHTCLNLKQDGTTLTKWSYSGDSGSDWALELVEEVTEDDVRTHLNAEKGFYGEIKSGKYYRIYNVQHDVYATENDYDVKSIVRNATNFAQYWKLIKDGEGYIFQNVLTQNYIQPQTNQSHIFRTASLSATLYPSRTDDKWLNLWTIANSAGGAYGMHTDGSKNVVMWSVNADASIWAFQEVELSDEDIEAARSVRKEYEDMVKNINTYQAALNNLFEDKACTTLKSNIQALTDAQLAENADFAALAQPIKDMVLKVKNNTWQQFTNKSTGYTAGYEKFFRVADYKVYSHFQKMCNGDNFTMSNSFGKLSGPTGIVAQANDIICIYVDQAPSTDCTLQLEAVSTNGVPGDNQTGSVTNLHQGLNIYSPSQQMMLYIFYQLNDPKLYLANYPDIKIHIEGGDLHGYWDATRGMTNADWALLQQDLLKNDVCKNLNLKTEHLVFAMDNALVKQYEPQEMEGLMRIWDMIPVNEERYMGVEDFEGRYRNIWNVFSINYNYMFATTYGTYYNESTLGTIMNYANMRKPGALWGPSHEMGHNHQASINVIGTTESSNNLFSNINTFEQGIQTSRRMLPSDNFNELAKGTPWLGRDIWNTTSMYFQLYLYFHVMHHDDQFLPNLFRKMRKNPINKNSGSGRTDYLHLAKMICDVAQADLSEFFESYGMFVPVSNYEVGDYSTYHVTTTQAEIDAAKAYMQKYPKKLGNIMFIDDHITPMKNANPDNIFEGIPTTSNGKKTNNTDQHNSSLPIGSFGDYEEFDGRTTYTVDGDFYRISGSTIYFQGTGCLGHKFYDKQGNLIWATNIKSGSMPDAVKNLAPDNVIVVAAEPNMTDTPCPYYKKNDVEKYNISMNFGNEENSRTWVANASTPLSDYMPTNAIGVVATVNAPDNITTTANIIDMDNTATSIVLDGDQPAYIPVETTAANVMFTKSIEGYAALDLPFDVTSTDVPGLQTAAVAGGNLTITNAESVAAGQPAVVNGNINLTLTNAIVKSGSYQAGDIIALNNEAKATVNVEQASPFTYAFSELATGIEAVCHDDISTNEKAMYDLSGRRVAKTDKAGIYIVNGKKQVVK